jgi:hypothetical protein
MWNTGKTPVKNVLIENIVFDGNISHQLNSKEDYDTKTGTIKFNTRYEQSGSVFIGSDEGQCENITLRDCRFEGSQGDGISVSKYCKKVRLEGITGRSCARGTIDVFGGASEVIIDRCCLDDLLHVEIDVSAVENGKVMTTNCIITNSIFKEFSAGGYIDKDGLRLFMSGCVVKNTPTFAGLGGVVSSCSFECNTPGSTSTARIIVSEDLIFRDCRFTSSFQDGAIISLEPTSDTDRIQRVVFDGCVFESQTNSKRVTAIRETDTWHAKGSQTIIRNCTSRGVGYLLSARRNGRYILEGNFVENGSAIAMLGHFQDITTESVSISGNTLINCDALVSFADNNAAIGKSLHLGNNTWISDTMTNPTFAGIYGYDKIRGVSDSRTIYTTKEKWSRSKPEAWKGCRVFISDADAAEPAEYFKVDDDPTNATDWRVLLAIGSVEK